MRIIICAMFDNKITHTWCALYTMCVSGRMKTLQQMHPAYTTDWTKTLSVRDEERLLHPAPDADHRTGYVFTRVLSTVSSPKETRGSGCPTVVTLIPG